MQTSWSLIVYPLTHRHLYDPAVLLQVFKVSLQISGVKIHSSKSPVQSLPVHPVLHLHVPVTGSHDSELACSQIHAEAQSVP